MLATFTIKSIHDVHECSREIRFFALDFGLATFESSLMSSAVSEATTNAVRYADGCTVGLDYTQNKKGLKVIVEDQGDGIKDIDLAMEDGYSSLGSSLGLGLGAIKRSVDKFTIDKSDSTGTTITLVKYLEKPTFDIAEVSIKKDGESFNGDASFVKHYDGDKSLLAVIDGAGSGFQAYQSSKLVEKFFEANYELALDELIYKAHTQLMKSELTRAVELSIMRILPKKIQYITLGNTFIKSTPYQSLFAYNGSLGLSLPKKINVSEFSIPNDFCIVMATDGLETTIDCPLDHQNLSANEVATELFNNYNLDDDSSLIVIKSGELI